MKNLNSKLKQLSKMTDVNEKVEVSKLFSAKFMMKYTQFLSFNDFIINSPFKTQDGFDKADLLERDKYVAEFTHFNSWDDMKSKAATEYFIGSKFM